MNQTCETCKHFIQHYVKMGYRYATTPGGHCVYPRLKLRYRDTPACKHYKERKKAD